MGTVNQETEWLRFTKDQLQGQSEGLNTAVYAKPEFLAIQMHQIRLGLLEQLPVEHYARTEYDWFQMEEIRKGLLQGLDITKYADPQIPFDVMRQVRKGLKLGMDLSSGVRFPSGVLRELRKSVSAKVNLVPYIQEGYEQDQLREIRLALQAGIAIAPYLSKAYRSASIREICAGLKSGVNVSLYAREQMSWRQMREIRLGLERRLDVSGYCNPLYSWQQMQEIRLGLEEGLAAETYASLMYTPKEMAKKRKALRHGIERHGSSKTRKKEQYGNFSISVSTDEMKAVLWLHGNPKSYEKQTLLQALHQSGVIRGIDEGALELLLGGFCEENKAVVAKGCRPRRGKAGWYEYFFPMGGKQALKLTESGAVDYRATPWFAIVKQGEKVAYYHPAEQGEAGFTVTGRTVAAAAGKEAKLLSGRGVELLADQRTYVAAADGRAELRSEGIWITELLIVDTVTAAMDPLVYDGSVYVQGSVGNGARIRVSGDVLVDGFVEGAFIEAGGDIFIREGSNGSEQGLLQAGGDVYANFFEAAHVHAAGNICANYCLSCELSAKGLVEIFGKNGLLAGGSCYAALGLKVNQAGNEAGIPTSLKLGKKDPFSEEETRLEKKEMKVNQEMVLLKTAYYDFQKNYSVEQRNAHPMYLKIENAIYTKELEMEKLMKKKVSLQRENEKYEQAEAVIDGVIFEGVYVEINGSAWKAQYREHVVLRNQGMRIAIYG